MERVQRTFWGALVRFPSHSPPPWSRLVIGDDSLRLMPRFREAAVFKREDVQRIVMDRYRGPFVFRTLFWIITSQRHTHAFVTWRTERLAQALRSEGWPVTDAL